MNSVGITCFWLILTLACFLLIMFSSISPIWIESPTRSLEFFNNTYLYYESIVGFGMLRFCKRQELKNPLNLCSFYDNLSYLPNIQWLAVSILYGLGALIILFSLLLSICLLCISGRTDKKLRTTIYVMQIISVILLALSLIIFPLCFDSNFVRNICGSQASIYELDECNLAWGYTLSAVAVLITVFCPVIIKQSIYFVEFEEKTFYKIASYEVIHESPYDSKPSNQKITTV